MNIKKLPAQHFHQFALMNILFKYNKTNSSNEANLIGKNPEHKPHPLNW